MPFPTMKSENAVKNSQNQAISARERALRLCVWSFRVQLKEENSIRDACTPQPGKIVFNTMRYRSSETVHRLGYFQSSVSVQIMFKYRK